MDHDTFVKLRAARKPTGKHEIRSVRVARARRAGTLDHPPGYVPRKVTRIVGAQWGDEGKGKVVGAVVRGESMSGDPAAKRGRAGLVYRYSGGPNAGHCTHMPRDSPELATGPHYNVSASCDGAGAGMIKLATHQLPTGAIYAAEPGNPAAGSIPTYIGHGCLVNLRLLHIELGKLEVALGHDAGGMQRGMHLSAQATLITAEHRIADADGGVAGSTGNGIRQAAMARASRECIRVADLFRDLGPHERSHTTQYRLGAYHDASAIDVPESMQPRIDEAGCRWLGNIRVIDTIQLTEIFAHVTDWVAEGAQGALLDVSQGTRPFNTSMCTLAAPSDEYGINPDIVETINLAKGYVSYVGNAAMEADFDKRVDYSGAYEILRAVGNELGTTTGRRRQLAPTDIDDIISSCKLNAATTLVINKADVLPIAEEMYAALRDSIGTFEAYCASHMSTWTPKMQSWAVGMVAYLRANPGVVANYPDSMYLLKQNGRVLRFDGWDAMFQHIVVEISAACRSVQNIVDYDSISGDVELVHVEY